MRSQGSGAFPVKSPGGALPGKFHYFPGNAASVPGYWAGSRGISQEIPWGSSGKSGRAVQNSLRPAILAICCALEFYIFYTIRRSGKEESDFELIGKPCAIADFVCIHR